MTEKCIIFEEILHHYIDVKQKPEETEEEAFERMAEEDMDLFADGDVIESGIIRIDGKSVRPSYADLEKALSAFLAYVKDDCEHSKINIIRNKLAGCGLSKEECEILGLGWVFKAE